MTHESRKPEISLFWLFPFDHITWNNVLGKFNGH